MYNISFYPLACKFNVIINSINSIVNINSMYVSMYAEFQANSEWEKTGGVQSKPLLLKHQALHQNISTDASKIYEALNMFWNE